ncbi:hypothetical protein I79_005764 [Cricetulus griseus]|uniref:Uncharacterized protein n=1 Tax=Cricetulus griseus TaxID=10029 RepID=G3H611_CRIGR|nr:hypothetical protein I79_005764 [Cricetulus griseus]
MVTCPTQCKMLWIGSNCSSTQYSGEHYGWLPGFRTPAHVGLCCADFAEDVMPLLPSKLVGQPASPEATLASEVQTKVLHLVVPLGT